MGRTAKRKNPSDEEYSNLHTLLFGREAREKNKSRPGGKVKWLKIIIVWLHQGFTYLDRTEMVCRVVWELLWACLAFWLLSYTGWPVWMCVILAFFISHVLNGIFNYNFWTGSTFYLPDTNNPGNEKTLIYLSKMQQRMKKYDCISGVMIYGSLSRGVWHDKSDMDIRVLRKPGLNNGIRAYLVVHSERVRALFNKQPLDMYLADGIGFLNLMRKDEFPVFLKANDERLVKRYRFVEEADFNKVLHVNDLSKGSSTKLERLYGNASGEA